MTRLRSRAERVVRGRRTLLRAALELLNAVNGLRPLGEGYLALPIYVFGWPTSELSTQLLAASVLDAARRGRRGDFAGGRGKIALLMTVAAWAGLAAIHHRGIASRTVLRAALQDGLGDDYPAALPTSPVNAGRPRGVFHTTLARHRYVDRTDTVSYGPHGSANLADVWRRRDLPRDGRAPVLVQVPGGAWTLGFRRGQAYPLLGHLAARGWVCVSMNYRVSPANSWPDHIVDVKRALAWVKQNIADYGGDPDFVAITGGSAGGHLATLAALTPHDPQFQPGFADADTSVAAAVPLYGRYDWVTTEGVGRREIIGYLQALVVKKRMEDHHQTFVDASPIHRVIPAAPPFFVLHGRNDSLIPVGEARAFVDALRSVSDSPVAYAELPGAQHGFEVFGTHRAHRSAEAVSQFLSWVHATSAQRGGICTPVNQSSDWPTQA